MPPTLMHIALCVVSVSTTLLWHVLLMPLFPLMTICANTVICFHRKSLAVQGPGDSAWQFNGRAFIHLRCNCRTQRDHGFDRCNRHISTRDHHNGYRYCFQCREHCAVTEANSFEAAMQMQRNWRRMQPATPITEVEAAFYTRRIFRDGIRDAPQDCHCDCAGCLGPEPPPEVPVVSEEPPLKRVRRS
jgi:hypothetical protein